MTDDKDLPLRAGIVPVTPFQQNCTILWCTKTMKAAVIDPGGDVPVILQGIEQTGVEVDKILLTHGHIDHAGGAAELKEKLGVPLIGPHRDDKFLLDTLEETGRSYGLAGARNCTPDEWLEAGGEIAIGDVVFELLHCPGHSPGSIVYFNRDARFAIMGDVLFQGSIGRTDLPRGDHDTLLRSIREKVFPLGDDVFFICGHGPASNIGHERKHNPFVGVNANG
jgi:hydroxyacylglutathione hydrolase